MPDDRSYVEANSRQRERLRALVERLDDEALSAPVNEYWTVAGVLGHLAYWDLRFQTLAEKIDRGEPWVAGDQEPDGDWLNDSMRPLIHALAPRTAAELALRIAEETERAQRKTRRAEERARAADAAIETAAVDVREGAAAWLRTQVDALRAEGESRARAEMREEPEPAQSKPRRRLFGRRR